jgi:hypothetical protein
MANLAVPVAVTASDRAMMATTTTQSPTNVGKPTAPVRLSLDGIFFPQTGRHDGFSMPTIRTEGNCFLPTHPGFIGGPKIIDSRRDPGLCRFPLPHNANTALTFCFATCVEKSWRTSQLGTALSTSGAEPPAANARYLA